MAKQDGYPIHEGPMADRRGTEWRKDAAELEARDRRRKENPTGALENSLRSHNKDHAARAKSDG